MDSGSGDNEDPDREEDDDDDDDLTTEIEHTDIDPTNIDPTDVDSQCMALFYFLFIIFNYYPFIHKNRCYYYYLATT